MHNSLNDPWQSLVKPTVAKAFLKSMQDLNTTLLSTGCNFVRCIKPNAKMRPGVFDNRLVPRALCLTQTGRRTTCHRNNASSQN